MEMPQIIRVFHPDLDLSGLRITLEHAHAVEAMESDLISAYCDMKLRKHVYGTWRCEARRRKASISPNAMETCAMVTIAPRPRSFAASSVAIDRGITNTD